MSLNNNDDINSCAKHFFEETVGETEQPSSLALALTLTNESTPYQSSSESVIKKEGHSDSKIRNRTSFTENTSKEDSDVEQSCEEPITTKEKKEDECPAELKSLRYKIMLMNGNTPPPTEEKHKKNNYDNLQQFLEKEKNNNNKENWSKLNKSLKQKKILDFVDNYKIANNLSEEEQSKLLELLKSNMNRGKLTKNKEVNYDRTKGIIKDMPCLVFNKTTRSFTIKNMDATKHSTTIKKVSLVRASSYVEPSF